MDLPEEDTKSRLQRAKEGNTGAFGELVAAVSVETELWLLVALRGDADLASAALQDAWTAAWREIESFMSEKHLLCWVRKVARRMAISEFRKRKRLVISEVEPLSDKRTHESLALPLEGRVYKAVQQLPERYRAVAALHYLHGCVLGQIAVLLKIPLTTVKMRMHRARHQLRAILGDEANQASRNLAGPRKGPHRKRRGLEDSSSSPLLVVWPQPVDAPRISVYPPAGAARVTSVTPLYRWPRGLRWVPCVRRARRRHAIDLTLARWWRQARRRLRPRDPPRRQ